MINIFRKLAVQKLLASFGKKLGLAISIILTTALSGAPIITNQPVLVDATLGGGL